MTHEVHTENAIETSEGFYIPPPSFTAADLAVEDNVKIWSGLTEEAVLGFVAEGRKEYGEGKLRTVTSSEDIL